MESRDQVLRSIANDVTDIEYHQDYRNSTVDQLKLLGVAAPLSIFILVLAYHLLWKFDRTWLSIPEVAWNVFVYVTPSGLVNVLDKQSVGKAHEAGTRGIHWSKTHAAKSEAMRRIFGLDRPGGIMGQVAQASRRRLSSLPGMSMVVECDDRRPAGLGNWDNSCYQNSVLQGLASLDTMTGYLSTPQNVDMVSSRKMADCLRELIGRLNDPSNNGKRIWTPAALKSMSSWQQQDAQEYFSKVLDEVDKEVAKAVSDSSRTQGLEDRSKPMRNLGDISLMRMGVGSSESSPLKNPLEGLLAQRVGCTVCGYAEGLSLIPFNCLTVPIGKDWYYELAECLNKYTELETIDGVECGKCTLLKYQGLHKKLVDRADPSTKSGMELRSDIVSRLDAIKAALEDDDYEDKTLHQKCKINTKNRITTTKSRQAVVARPPKSLVMHVNRSLFDEQTGDLSKNHAEVRFPRTLDLGPWCLGSTMSATENNADVEEWLLDPARSMIASSQEPSRILGPLYELRAVITHYGRHENGHYICYRKHNASAKSSAHNDEIQAPWWRLSDDDVSQVSEDDVLGQGGVFMLFYDCVDGGTVVKSSGVVAELPVDSNMASNVTPPVVNQSEAVDGATLLSADLDADDLPQNASQSIAATLSETDESEGWGAQEDYRPTKAIHIPARRQPHGPSVGGPNAGAPAQSSNMVMV